jgi:hypothetical protein
MPAVRKYQPSAAIPPRASKAPNIAVRKVLSKGHGAPDESAVWQEVSDDDELEIFDNEPVRIPSVMPRLEVEMRAPEESEVRILCAPISGDLIEDLSPTFDTTPRASARPTVPLGRPAEVITVSEKDLVAQSFEALMQRPVPVMPNAHAYRAPSKEAPVSISTQSLLATVDAPKRRGWLVPVVAAAVVSVGLAVFGVKLYADKANLPVTNSESVVDLKAPPP